MIPHSLCSTLCARLESSVPGLHAYCYTSTEELEKPYVTLSTAAEEERVKGNHTWDISISVEFRADAYDTNTAQQQGMFQAICATLDATNLRNGLNGEASDFYLYSIRIDSIEEPSSIDKDFTQTARVRALIQF